MFLREAWFDDCMLPREIRIALFLGLWHEMAAHFQTGIDAAFVMTLLVVYGHRLMRCASVELAGLSGPVTAAFLIWGALWVALFFWLAPSAIRQWPLTVILGATAALVLGGVRCRQQFEQDREKFGKAWFRERSEEVVVTMFAAFGAVFLSRRQWGSALPLLGYIALVALPLAFGWMGAAPRPETKFDASFGDDKTFRDAGMSDEY